MKFPTQENAVPLEFGATRAARIEEVSAKYQVPLRPEVAKGGSPTLKSESVPVGWSIRTVSETGDVLTGKALAVNAPGPQRPYLRTKNVLDGAIDIDDVLTMPMTDKQFEQFAIVPGDVLLNEGQSLELVGRCSVYRGEYPGPCAMQNQLLRYRARRGTSAEFAAQLFRFSQQTGVFARIALQTTSIAHLGGSRFERLRLAWPDALGEQEAIAEALSDVDGLLGALDALIAKKRAIKQAAMQQLLTGKTRLPGFSGEWETKPLGELSEIRSGGTPSTGDPSAWGGDIPWCTPTDITALYGHKYLVATSRTITIQGLKNCSAELIPAGSVVMTSRATIGECAVNLVPVTTNQGFKNFVPSECVHGEFLYYLLTTQKAGFVALCGGSTFLEIGKSQLRSYQVRIPANVEEQAAISTVLSDMDAEIIGLECRREKTRAIKQGMMQQLLTGRVRLVQPPGDADARRS